MSSHIGSGSGVVTFITTPGDIANKTSAAGEQIKETLSYELKAGATAAITAAGAAVALKYAPVKDTFNNVANKGASWLSKTMSGVMSKIKPEGFFGKMLNGAVGLVKSAADGIMKLSPKAKVLLTAATIGGAFLTHFFAQHKYNQGQIDKKHEIIADLRAHQEGVVK